MYTRTARAFHSLVRAVTAALLATAVSSNAASAETASLTVKISGLHNYNGRLVLYLWPDNDEKTRFPDPSHVPKRDERGNGTPCDFSSYSVCRRAVESLQDLEADCVFKDLPRGTYAVFVFHDENRDWVLNTGIFKRPLEARGASRVLPEDLRGITNQVEFSKASFTLAEPASVTVGLKYPPRW
jgi:uncharacterized protein (DUF2141 family)